MLGRPAERERPFFSRAWEEDDTGRTDRRGEPTVEAGFIVGLIGLNNGWGEKGGRTGDCQVDAADGKPESEALETQAVVLTEFGRRKS